MKKAIPETGAAGFLAGDGETVRLIREFDWTRTPLGIISRWPLALKITLATMLSSRQPMFLWWGPELIQFYNDAYIPIFGVGRHPSAMGQRGFECWQEVWPMIWPQIDDVMSRGKASWNEDQLVPLFRNGRMEDVYGSYSYSPVVGDDGRVAGTLAVCMETTGKVVAQRRQQVARSLSEAFAAPAHEQSAKTRRAFLDVSIDVPAALFYRASPHDRTLTSVGDFGLDEVALARADNAFRRTYAWSPELPEAIAAGRPMLLESVFMLPGTRGAEPVRDACVVPARIADGKTGSDLAVYALNPRIPFDAGYRDFSVLLTRNMSLPTFIAATSGRPRGAQTDLGFRKGNGSHDS